MELDDYYNIDNILAEQTKIPCIALHDFRKELNLTGDHTDVKRNTRIELPYWVVKPLAQFTLPAETEDEVGDSLITVELPKTYGTKVRNALEASPTSVDFKLLCPYFYLFGVKLLDLVIDESLTGVLEKAFKARLRDIMDFSQAVVSFVGQDFLQKLDETERELFKSGQESAISFRQWRDRSIRHIKTVDLGSRA